jgi:hypothetical protein
MKKQLLFALALFAGSLYAQDFQWVKTAGATGDDYGSAICIDNAGNSYAAGYGTVNYVPPNFYYGMRIAKYNDAGTEVWAKQILNPNVGTHSVVAYDIATDAAGNVYVVGAFFGTIDFDPSGAGVVQVTSQSSTDDGFILKLDNNGDFQWVKAIKSFNFIDIRKIAINSAGEILVGGVFSGTVDFDPSGVISNQSSLGMKDAFYGKFNSDGDLLWVKQIGSEYDVSIVGLEVDASDNIYVAGSFKVAGNFDVGNSPQNLTTADVYADAYILKVSNAGTFDWVKQIGASQYNDNMIKAMSVGTHICLVGNFTNEIDFDPGPGEAIMEFQSEIDGYVLSLNLNGEFNWVKQLTANGSGSVDIRNVTQNAAGDLALTGAFRGVVDFDPNTGTFNLSSNGLVLSDLFVWHLTSDGNFGWAINCGGVYDNYQRGDDVALDNDGNIWAIGRFIGTVDFNPGAGVYNQTAVGGYDAYILKLSTAEVVEPPVGIDNVDVLNFLRIHPNPVSTTLFVQTEFSGIASIVNIDGRKMETFELNGNATLDLSKYPAGVYFIQLENGASAKFVKQ